MERPFEIYRTTKKPGQDLALHAHPQGQLTIAASGMLQVHTESGVWMVPPQLAAWVPPGARHRLDILPET